MKKVVIIGAGGFAREVLDVIEACNQKNREFDMLGYIVDPEYGSPGTMINEKPILGDFDWLKCYAREVYVICGVGPSHHRFQLIKRADEIGCQYFSLIHPKAIVTPRVEIGRGVVITAGCILTNQIKIDNHVHINLDCTIGHDATLDEFVTLAPGVHVSGKVSIEKGSYVGTGANIIERINIGKWSIIGAGSTIVKDVLENTTVVGVPGKVIKKHKIGWHRRYNEE